MAYSDAVNMTAKELEDWLATGESRSVGDKSSGSESTGHASDRRIVDLLRTKKADLTEDDAAHMPQRSAPTARALLRTTRGTSTTAADTSTPHSLLAMESRSSGSVSLGKEAVNRRMRPFSSTAHRER